MGDPVSIGITVALTAAQMAASASRRIEGPRLQELSVTTSDYGTALFNFYGLRRADACPVMWANPLREVKSRTKTKGGKHSDYTYFADWASHFADHDIAGITRIWFDKQLVYDATGAGPTTPFVIGYSRTTKSGRQRTVAVNLADHFRVYLGTADQEPDPLIEASVDAKEGAGSTPAYRRQSYGVFDGVPVEKFGNRIPQVSFEGTRDATPTYPYEQLDGQLGTQPWNISVSRDGATLVDARDNYHVWHLPSRSLVVAGAVSAFDTNLTQGARLGLFADGSWVAVDSDRTHLLSYSAEGIYQGSSLTFASSQQEVRVLRDADDGEHVATIPFSINYYFYFDGVERRMLDITGVNWSPREWVEDGFGDIWAIGRVVNATVTTCYLYRMLNSSGRAVTDFITLTGLTSNGSVLDGVSGAAFANDDGSVDTMVIGWDEDTLYSVDLVTGTIVDSRVVNWSNTQGACQFANVAPGSDSVFLSIDALSVLEIDLATLATRRTISIPDWAAVTISKMVYVPVLNALAVWNSGDYSSLWMLYLDRIGGAGVTYATIAADIAATCKLSPTDYDFSALTQSITGFSWTQGSGKDIIDPLRELFDVDFRPHDFKLQGLLRGGAAGAAIGSDDFARLDRQDPAWSAPDDGDTDLPRAIRLSFADADADQQNGSAVALRPLESGDTVRELPIDMTPLVLTPAQGKQFVDRMLRRRWFGAQGYALTLTGQYAALEPGDVRPLILDGETVTARLVTMAAEADSSIATEWERDDPSVHSLSGADGAPQDGYVPPVMFVPVPTRTLVADVPLAIDAHDQAMPFLYYGAGPLAAGLWPGAELEVSDSGLVDDFAGPWASVGSGDAMHWGFTTAAIGAALPWIFDRATAISVVMKSGTPVSTTEDALLADGALNLVLVGGEYIQFATATLESDGSYTLTDLLRGCRGTEAAITAHLAGETLVLVDTAIFRRDIGASEIGDSDAYRGTAHGANALASPVISIAFTAAAQRPYAPVHGTLTLDSGSGDWTVAAVRRTRIGGANIDGGDVPLGETSDAWEADIMDGATVKRTLTGTSLPLTYSSADQTTDWGAPQTSLDVNLYQMSPVLALRGFPLALAA